MNLRNYIRLEVRKRLAEGLDDKWVNKGVEVTLQQLLKITQDYPTIDVPTQKLKGKVLDWNGDSEEIKKIESSNLEFPVLIVVDDNNEIQYVLDGNHRVQKALRNKLPTIKAKLIKIRELPEDFQYVLG